MRIWKKRITGFLIAMCAFCITAGVGTTQNVQAATKATYTIKKIQEKKTYKSSSATYSYELPQLKGNSTAVKRINHSSQVFSPHHSLSINSRISSRWKGVISSVSYANLRLK